jgi:hypothetical protein
MRGPPSTRPAPAPNRNRACPPFLAMVLMLVMISRLIRILAMLFLCLAIPAAAQDEAPVTQDATPTKRGETPGERGKTEIRIDLANVLAQARQAVRDGDFRRAVGLYQFILRFAPNFRPARVELSFALARLGERERAARLLRDIDREGLDPDVIAVIDRILGPDRLKFFVIPELIIDSNINGQTTKDAVLINGRRFILSEDAKGRRAYGYGLTVGAAWRLLDAAPRTTLTLGTRVRDLNARQDDSLDIFGSLSFGFQAGPRTVLTPSLSGAYRTKADAAYEVEHAGGISFAFPIGPVQAGLSGRYRMIEGRGDWKETRDRRRSELNSSLGYGFPGLGIRLDGGFFREDWLERETQDNEGFATGLDFTLTKMPRVTPTVGGSFTRTDFENEDLFFGVKREDRDYEGHIDLQLNGLNLFGTGAPILRYRYRHETSSIGLFEYNEHEVSIGFKAITF